MTSHGVRVGIRITDPHALYSVLEHLPPTWKVSQSPAVERLYSLHTGGTGQRRGVRRFHLLYGDEARLARSESLDEACEVLGADLQLYVAEAAPRRVFVHAGVVGWGGWAILIPGRSLSGKTTLVAELVRAGAVYYSDEYAVLDARGRVHPYPRPLSIREDGGYRQRKCSAESLGGMIGTKPLPVRLVVVSRYKAGARWRPRRLSAGRGILELLSNTVSARRQPGKALAALQQVVVGARVVKGARGEAREVVDSILRCLGD